MSHKTTQDKRDLCWHNMKFVSPTLFDSNTEKKLERKKMDITQRTENTSTYTTTHGFHRHCKYKTRHIWSKDTSSCELAQHSRWKTVWWWNIRVISYCWSKNCQYILTC